MSQEKLAELLSRSRSCISKFENDQKMLDVPTYVRWMEATNAKEAMIATLCGVDPLAVRAANYSHYGFVWRMKMRKAIFKSIDHEGITAEMICIEQLQKN
ncbi:hypothetical protein BsIDN1_46160 [Bacillus safensis]|uniref:Uncharacterized protein n=1 Tax=Bacillus safensis TaxID=561879 RepID=A0A5S9MDD5_BACIA|nr:hypothetical protein BsIDN1_46160 [Bacillus safensis]